MIPCIWNTAPYWKYIISQFISIIYQNLVHNISAWHLYLYLSIFLFSTVSWSSFPCLLFSCSGSCLGVHLNTLPAYKYEHTGLDSPLSHQLYCGVTILILVELLLIYTSVSKRRIRPIESTVCYRITVPIVLLSVLFCSCIWHSLSFQYTG